MMDRLPRTQSTISDVLPRRADAVRSIVTHGFCSTIKATSTETTTRRNNMSHSSMSLPPTRLTVGARAVVGCGRLDDNMVRNEPKTTPRNVKSSAPVGSLIKIEANPDPGNPYPVEDLTNGYRWWYVQTENGVRGWTTETGPKSNHDQTIVYYLDPVAIPKCPGALPSRLQARQRARVITGNDRTHASIEGWNHGAYSGKARKRHRSSTAM